MSYGHDCGTEYNASVVTPAKPPARETHWLVFLGVAVFWLFASTVRVPVSLAQVPGEASTDLPRTWRIHYGELDPALGLGGAELSQLDFDASSWPTTGVPGPFVRSEDKARGAHSAWIRTVVQLESAPRPSRQHLGVAIGRVNSAYEIWAGGQRLGGVGRLPASVGGADPPEIDYDRQAVWPVPADTVAADGRLALALHVWTDPQLGHVGGPHEGRFRVGPLAELVAERYRSELPNTILISLFLLLAFFHLELFRRRREERGYLWFAVVATLVATYSFLRTQWKYVWLSGLSFELLKETEHVVAFLLLPSFIQLVFILLNLEFKLHYRVGQWASVSLAVVAVVVPGIGINQVLIRIWEVLIVAFVVLGIAMVYRERRQRAAQTIWAGILIGCATFLHDILVDLDVLHTPRLIVFGFAAYVFSLAATLAVRFGEEMEKAEQARRAQMELEASRLVAARSDEAKTQFLANMSHEIRTPMTAILGGVELLMHEDDLPTNARPRLRVIQRSGVSLLRLIDDILDFTKIEAGNLEVEALAFDLHQLLSESVELFRPQAEAKRIDLRLTRGDGLPRRVLGDPSRLRQVLLNLVSNAVKFTSEGGVEVSAEALDTKRDGRFLLRLTIADSGPGIPPESVPRLFEPFTQADASTSRRHGGSGLGLAISRRLAVLMEGEIKVDSRLGEGISIHLSIPLARPQPDSVEFDSEDADTATSWTKDRWQGRRVLLVEDNPVNQMIITEQLRLLGLEVLLADDGAQALEILDVEPLDLVLMDCQMPHVDGYEATRRWRAKEDGARLPIVALTAHALDGERERCLAAGMDDFLTKPFRGAQLEEFLARWLTR